MEYRTLPEIVQYSFTQYRTSGAFFYRRGDGWQALSSESFLETIRRLALAFKSFGLKKGDVVAVIAPSSPWWLMVDLAIMVAGGRSTAVFPKISTKNLLYQLEDAGVRFAYADDASLWEQARAGCKGCEKVILRGLDVEDQNAIDIQDFLKAGDTFSIEKPEQYIRLRDEISPDDIATIIYTSGSTGEPKGVALTHVNMCSQIRTACKLFKLDPLTDRALSALPLAHSFERVVVYTYFAQGIPIYFADDIQRLKEYLPEVHPTVMTMVPRILEKLFSKLQQKIGTSPTFSKMVGEWGCRIALEEDPHGVSQVLADTLFFKKIRDSLGGALQMVIVGGAALDEKLCRFFNHAGIPIYEGYGLTETSPVLCSNYPGCNTFGSVGPAFGEVQLKIAGPEHELRCKGPNIMWGYYNKREETAARYDDEGWFCTGDKAEIDDKGIVRITGRLSEMFKTSTGKFVSPVPIEQALLKHPLIDAAMVLAEGRSFVGVLLFADQEAIEHCKKSCAKKSCIDDFSDTCCMRKSLQKHIDAINTNLNTWENIRVFSFITEAPTVESGQLTPTMKLCRQVVAHIHADRIEKMFKRG